MSSKINVLSIIIGHIKTLKDPTGNAFQVQDIITFFLVPLFASAIGIWLDFKLTDQVTSLLVNFGAIFTALLLSVLVLVYDQGTKVEEKIISSTADLHQILKLKQLLLEQLYFNICYSIVLSVGLVFLCLIEKVLRGHLLGIDISMWDVSVVMDVDLGLWLFSPIVIFLTLHLMLTILMVVKRMHILLTTK